MINYDPITDHNTDHCTSTLRLIGIDGATV